MVMQVVPDATILSSPPACWLSCHTATTVVTVKVPDHVLMVVHVVIVDWWCAGSAEVSSSEGFPSWGLHDSYRYTP